LKELIRIVVPGGLLIFQLPSERKQKEESNILRSIKSIFPIAVLNFSRKLRFRMQAEMEMYGMKPNEVAEVFKVCGAKIVDRVQDEWAGKEWVSFRYSVVKNSPVA